MSTPIKVLMVEDQESDAELILHTLTHDGLEVDWKRVDTEAAYRAEIAAGPDVILSDARLPQFSAEAALAIRNQLGINIPFIIVTGSLSEETAVGFIKQGATDYLLKDRTARLGEAVRNALQEKALRAENLQAERSRERANRAYRTLSAGNRSLMRSNTEEELIKSICEVGVRASGYRMVWVGFAEHDEAKTLRPVAWAGHEDGYLTQKNMTWADNQRGQRPDSRAIRSHSPVIAQNIATDPDYKLWKDTATLRGYGSALAAPLILDDQTMLGSITFYSEEPDAFDAKETELLLEMAGDLCYGIQALRTRSRNEQAERALRESEARFRIAIDEAPFPVMIHADDGEIMTVNRIWTDITGYKLIDVPVIARWVELGYGAERAPKIMSHINRMYSITGRFDEGEDTISCKDDSRRVWEFSSAPLGLLPDGRRGIISMAVDITERKDLEKGEHDERIFAEALLDSVATINSTLNLTEVLNRILSNVRKVINADAYNLMLVNPHQLTVQVVAAASHDGKVILEPETPYSYDDLPGIRRIIETRRPLVVPDTAPLGNWSSLPVTNWVRSYTGAPVIVGDEVIGVLNLDSTQPAAFSDTDSERLLAFANQAAVAIHNAQLYSELENYGAILEQAVKERTTEIALLKDRLQRILDNSPDPVIILDQNTRIETANPAFHAMFRTDPDAMFRKPLTSLVAPESEQAVLDGLGDLVVHGRVARFAVTARRPDQTTFEADMALAPIREESLTLGAVCILRDMTAFKEIERIKDQFVANVSHELRTPITGLKLNFDLLSRDPARQDVYKSRLKREIDRLNDLIEDLLRLSRLDRGRTELNLTEVNLNELIRQHVGDRTPIAESNGLTLEARELARLPPVQGDAGLLGQAISVLLTNALNYTPEGGRVTLEAVTSKVKGKQWVGVRVSDTGPGIPPDDLPHLFERFYRGRVGRESGKTGTGLGLAIASEIIDRHGGRVELNSAGVPGEGAIFTLWLPAYTP